MTRRSEVDDTALLRLLWQPDRPTGTRPGPRSSLTLRAVVRAGIDLADDRDGPALSMRLVAERLGCTPMALYSYVDGKDTLLRLMYDAAHAGFTPPEPTGADPAAVETQVLAWVTTLVDLYATHHWLADVSWSRPVLGPHEQEVLESLLRLLDPLALDPAVRGTLASMLLTQGRSTGRLVADARHAAASGVDDAHWWQAQSAAMAELVPDLATRFPLSAGLGAAPATADLPSDHDERTQGYLERAARARLAHGVRLLLAGASAA
jgi:AcrR family transcriptional regulator